MSDYKGAALMLSALPKAKELLADKGYDAVWFRPALAKRDVAVCIPSKSNRKVAIPYHVVLYKQRHKIENMFGRLKDWRRIHTRYDRCAHTYLSAICIATLTKPSARVFQSVVDLQAAMRQFLEDHNAQSKPFEWIADR